MGWNEDGSAFTNTELDRISKMYYDCMDEKKKIELTLSQAEFHYKHLQKNKENSRLSLFTWSMAIVPYTAVWLICIIGVVVVLAHGASGTYDGFILLAGLLGIVFLTPPALKMWKRYLGTANRFVGVDEKLFGVAGYRKNYADDERETEETLTMLRMSMERVDAEIAELDRQRGDEIERIRLRNKQKLLYQDEEIKTEKETKEDTPLRISIKPVNLSEDERNELMHDYDRDIERYEDELRELEKQYYDSYELADKIDVEGEQAIRESILIIVLYLVIAMIANSLLGDASVGRVTFINLFMTAFLIGVMVRLFKVDSPRIKRYVVENNRDMVDTYADNRNLITTDEMRERLTEKIATCERELEYARYNKMLVKEGIKNS